MQLKYKTRVLQLTQLSRFVFLLAVGTSQANLINHNFLLCLCRCAEPEPKAPLFHTSFITIILLASLLLNASFSCFPQKKLNYDFCIQFCLCL